MTAEQQLQLLIKKIKTCRIRFFKLVRQVDASLSGYTEECDQTLERVTKRLKLVKNPGRAKKKKTSG